MAIRRLSDLPELKTTYSDDFTGSDALENLKKCMIEVSYRHTGSIWQSFYACLKDIIDIAHTGMDFDQYVKLAGDQTITGKKTFTSSSGLAVSSSRGIIVNGGNIKNVTTSGSDIDAATVENNVIATVKAIKDYIDSKNFLSMEGFDPSKLVELISVLQSMLSESDAKYYVDNVNGNDTTGTGTVQKPYKTIERAVKQANFRRFVGTNSNCYIYLISDYEVQYTAAGLPKTIQLFHPDLVQTKQMYIYGYDASTSSFSAVKRRISYENAVIQEYFYSLIATMCNCTFKNIEFKGKLENNDIWNRDFGATFYTINNMTSSCQCRVDSCKFSGCNTALVGNAFTIADCAFDCCKTCLNGSNSGTQRSNITGDITTTWCYNFLEMAFGSYVYISFSGRTRLNIECTYRPFTIGTGSTININAMNTNAGMVGVDGKYIGSSNWLFTFYIRDSASACTRVTLPATSDGKVSSSEFQNFIHKLVNADGIGYNDNGYFTMSGLFKPDSQDKVDVKYIKSFLDYDLPS